MPVPSHWWRQNFWGGCAQQRLETGLFSLCDYADDIALTSNTAENLQLQLNKFYDYTRFKGLKLNTDKTKVMVFFSRGNFAISTFTYDGTSQELVTEFKSLGITLRDGSMLTAAKKMADTAIARVYRNGDRKGIKHRDHAMLWLFQVFALTAGLSVVKYGSLLRHMIPQKPPPHMSFILAS